MTTPGMRQLAVPDGLDGERLDAAMARMFGLSRSRAAELISDGLVLLDGRPAVKSDRVLAGDPLQVTLPAPRPAEPPRRVEGLVVLYEDNDIVVVDKPRGVAAHPTPGWSGPTVIGGLVAGGATVAARSGTHPAWGDGRFAVVSDGRPSITHYDTLEAFRGASLVSVHLETGRTHQIRVHMAAIRHVCVGDLLYGADPVLAAHLGLTRQWLHAVSLSFEDPAEARQVSFTSTSPADLAHALDVLQAES